jgi:hypothetical protein
MALNAGSISVDGFGNATGTGLAIDMFNDALASLTSDTRKQIAAQIAPFFNGLATAIVSHIVANAAVTVTIHTTDSGLQRLTATFVPNADTQGPSADKTLSGTVA